MGFFTKRTKVDVDQQFKDLYKEINQIVARANKELDSEIKLATLLLAKEKYDQLLALIDAGANFEKAHFAALKANVEQQIEMNRNL